ncbi:MAG: pantoate--beta-alanine ligase [Bacteroidales bacterium]|jgi:pantoate--beta-alanine ligase|nr:pantoate--beta-alanine ligase [Bacteroidales bacterium]
MIVCTNKNALSQAIETLKAQKKTIGFVPTMGALHQGHISLINRSVSECDATVASIFVNPVQFNNPTDLQTYPRTLEADLELLEKNNCTIVFVPQVDDIYPEGTQNLEHYDFGTLETVMEGTFRPGHFNGVAIVVKRLFDLVQADVAFFGNKDFQQVAIVKQLVQQYTIPTHIVACPIVRESDGLAMSSRNMRLTAGERKQAAQISQTLFAAQSTVQTHTVQEIKDFVVQTINAVPALKVEYFDIVDATRLQPVHSWSEASHIVGCVAVHVGSVRLIDNIVLKN